MNSLKLGRLNERGSLDMILAGIVFVLVVAVVGYRLLNNSFAATSSEVANATACAPAGAWSSSSATGGKDLDGYFFYNNEYNAVSGSSETIWASSGTSWGVCARQPNPPAGVKSYPEEQKTVNVAINKFADMTDTVSYKLPSKGTWEAADDLWINGTPGKAGAIEVMIWPYTHYARPAGTDEGTIQAGTQAYTFWKRTGSNPIYTFQYPTNSTSTTMHMLTVFKWMASHGYISLSDTFSQFNFGYEIVGTGTGNPTDDFTTTNFSLNLAE